jgi:hypothetical protein
LIVVYSVTSSVVVWCGEGESERASKPAYVICGYQRCSDKSGQSPPQPHQLYHIHLFHSSRLVISEHPHGVYDADIHIDIGLPPFSRSSGMSAREAPAATCLPSPPVLLPWALSLLLVNQAQIDVEFRRKVLSRANPPTQASSVGSSLDSRIPEQIQRSSRSRQLKLKDRISSLRRGSARNLAHAKIALRQWQSLGSSQTR